jgi:hypothetical protein
MGPWKVYLVPKGINVKTVTNLDGGLGNGGEGSMKFHVTGESEPVPISFLGQSPISRVKHWNLQVKKMVSSFYTCMLATSPCFQPSCWGWKVAKHTTVSCVLQV